VINGVAERFGSLTTLVNNAAPTVEVASFIKPLVDVTTEEWELILRRADGQRVLELQVRIHLAAAGGGSIINISPANRSSEWEDFGYAAAKGGMNSLTRSIAVEAAADNIRCNTIVVGRVVAKGDSGGHHAGNSLPRRAERHRIRRPSSRPTRQRSSPVRSSPPTAASPSTPETWRDGSSDVLGSTVLHDVDAGVATITLNRPEAGNAVLLSSATS
jgi:NAD(P)-dependent dehydrogenase (short-subunit alcohol dehydrogenase family)